MGGLRGGWAVAVGLCLSLGAQAAPGAKGAKPTAAQAKANAQKYKAALKAGRLAAQAKNHGEAVKQLLVARELAPTNATVLGELGWAQFNAGALDDARSTLSSALYHTEDPKVRGMLYYNLGRVHEAQGRPDEAWDAWRRSLAARPNETVSRRFSDLKRPTFTRVADPAAFCNDFKELWACGEERQCTCTVERQEKSPDYESGGSPITSAEGHTEFNRHVPLAAAILKLEAESNGSLTSRMLVVQTGSGGWQKVGVVAEDWSPGVSYIHNNGEITRLAFERELGTGEGHILELETSTSNSDGDYGANLTELDAHRDVWLCHFTEPANETACHRFRVFSEVGTVPMIDGEPTEGQPSTRTWKRDWKIEFGQLRTLPVQGVTAGAEDEPYPLKTLGRRPGTEVVPLR